MHNTIHCNILDYFCNFAIEINKEPKSRIYQDAALFLMTIMKDSIVQILLGSLDNLCNRKEQLWTDNGYNHTDYNINPTAYPRAESDVVGCASGVVSTKTGNYIDYAYKSDDKSYSNGYIAKRIEELGRTVEFLKKITHNFCVFVIRKISDYNSKGCDKDVCYTA